MGKRRRRRLEEQDAPPRSSRMMIIAGIVVVVVSAAVGVGLVSLLGGSALSEDEEPLDIPPMAAPEPQFPRSEAADLLSNKSFNDMTAEERDLVRREAQRVFDNAEFRVVTTFSPGIDIVRRNGETRATRQYRDGRTPAGDRSLIDTRSFFCENEDGQTLTVYRGHVTVLGNETEQLTFAREQVLLDRELTAVDWSDMADLGFKEINGRRVHGVEMPFTVRGGGRTVPFQMWFDVETALLRERTEIGVTPEANIQYNFDWNVPPKIEPPPELPEVPCIDEIYPQ